MDLDEKAGMLLIDSPSAPAAPNTLSRARRPARLVNDEKMTRFIFRNVVTTRPAPATVPTGGGPRQGPGNALFGAPVTPRQAAEFTNAVQALAEGTRLYFLGSFFKSNARNHYKKQARQGINQAAGAFSVSGRRRRVSPRQRATWR